MRSIFFLFLFLGLGLTVRCTTLQLANAELAHAELSNAELAHADIDIGLIQQTWPNTAFAPPTSAVVSSTPSISFSSSSPPFVLDYTSVRFTGTITDSQSELVLFTAYTEGGVRLWIDDHLVITDGNTHIDQPSNRTAFLRIPFTAGTPQPFRLEYSRWSASSTPTLILYWQGNSTTTQIVPTNAFSPIVAAAELERVKLRDRLVNPRIAWQTYDNPTMSSHVNMPSGFNVYSTLADATTGDIMRDIIVFRRSNPALSLAGLHSLNGSDYTQLSISRWKTRQCDVSLETTVVNDGRDLLFLASSNGTDCANVLLLITPTMMEERFGTITQGSDGLSVNAVLPGFENVKVTAVGCKPVTFSKAGSGPYLALPLDAGSGSGSGIVGYTALIGSDVAPDGGIPAMQSAISTARNIVDTYKLRYGDLADVYEAMESILAWNTMYTPLEGVITPVSRGWNFGAGYVIFDWDNLFLSYMASFESGTLKDISYSNLIQIIQARTLLGFVPNFASGTGISFDRTEPQIGAFVVQQIYNKWQDGWIVDLLFPALLSWNNWVWTHRRGEGVLAGPDGHADLIVLGSDPTDPPCRTGGYNNLQAARYESGLDNSPMYDGSDDCGTGGPVCFDPNVTHHMSLYDVGMTALYLSDTEALISLAEVAGRFDLVPELQDRFTRIQTAMNQHMWDPVTNMYSNVLYNGSFYKRFAPTSFFPLISGSASDVQADAMMKTFTAPDGFCFNTSYTPDVNASMLVQWYNGKDNALGLSQYSLQEFVDDAYNFVRIEAVSLLSSAPMPANGVSLNLYYSETNLDNALVAGNNPPDASYAFVRQEGWCYSSIPSPSPGGWLVTNITLWWSPSRKDFKTCGGSECEQDTGPDYVNRGFQCFALSGEGPLNLPCKFGGSSISRGDPAFYDNNYWRGRIWGPHYQLMYWGLKRYDHVPSVHAARQEMVTMGKALMLQNWYLFHQVCENVNGIHGICEDVGNADPFYHWGALFGFLSFEENGSY